MRHLSFLFLCGCSTLILGLFAHYVDYLASATNKTPLRKISTNVYGAVFTLFVTLMYTSLLIIEGAGADMDRFVRLVDGRDHLNDTEEEMGCILHAFLLGYMLQDLIARLVLHDNDLGYFIHHVACIVGILICLIYGQSSVFCAAIGLSEFSTPLVGILSIAKITKMDKLLFYGGLLLNIQWPIRVALTSWICYIWYFQHLDSPFINENLKYADYVVNSIGLVLGTTLALLNWIWWGELLSLTFQALKGEDDKKLKST